MSYLTLTNNTNGQIFGYDTSKPDNLTINTSAESMKDTVSTLEAALAIAQKTAAAFGVDISTETATSNTSAASGTAT